MISKRAFRIFLGAAVFAALVSLLIRIFAPDYIFSISISDTEIITTYFYAWLLFTFYLLTLSCLYFLAWKWKLKTKRWLVIAHYTFVILMLIFFAAFSAFDTPQFQDMLLRMNVPFTSIIVAYAILLILDIVLFTISLLILLVNMFFLEGEGGRRNK